MLLTLMMKKKRFPRFKAWVYRNFYKGRIFSIKTEFAPQLMDIVIIEPGSGEKAEFLYVGKDKFLRAKDMESQGQYARLKISGNFSLYEILL